MTDQELLELAAKAVGYTVLHHVDGYVDEYGNGPDYGLQIEGYYCVWNPLDDDDDALRLATRLKINIVFVGTFVRCSGSGKDFVIVDEELGENEGKATQKLFG